MPLLVNSVPNLAQGVSQQPDNLRYPGQCDEQINAWATVVEGLKKRPNTNYVKNIDSSSTSSNLFTHFVKRDENNQYVLTVSLGGVGVTDLADGTKMSVFVTSIASTYLGLSIAASLGGVTNPLADLRALTVADYTFVVNKNKKVLKDTNSLGPTPSKQALIVVKLGDYEKGYSIRINGELVPLASTIAANPHSYTHHGHQPATYISGGSGSTGDGKHADTEYIAQDLAECLDEEYGTSGVSGISSVTITNGGSGWLVEPNFNAGVGKAFANNNITKVTFTADQTGITVGAKAKGIATVTNGEITELVFTNRGQGYNSDTTTYPITYSFESYYYNWRKWNLGAYTTPPTNPTITTTVGTLAVYNIEREDSVIRISSRDVDDENEDFDIRVNDGLANQGLSLIYKEVESITDLPKSCYNDHSVKVIGDADIDQDDYYVKFKTKDGTDFGEGSWIEVMGWENDGSEAAVDVAISSQFDINTMPVTLKPTLDNLGNVQSFRLQAPQEDETVEAPKQIGWRNREAGDNFTNPFPSFTDNKINDVFFFKNRLGFLTESAVVFSEADEYFNFFRTTTQQLLDSAPIDVGLSHTKVAILQHAIPFQEKLMLFSKQSQFVLRGADVLSPKTVAISPVTEFDISDSVEPVALGNYIYFTFKRNEFEGMYEYFVDNNTELFDAEEVTQQVPKYIPNNVRKIVGSQAENTVVVGVDSDLKTLYVYKYFWSNKEKIQSAWMKFTFDRDVVGFDFIDSKLYMITKDTDGLHLEFLTLEDGLKDTGLDYALLLDSRVDGSTLTVSYSASTKKSTISNFPYDPTGVDVYSKIGHKYDFTRTSATAGEVSGDITSVPFFAGLPYDMLYRFSDQSLKQPTERGGRSASDYTYQTIRGGSINYADTGHFVVEVTPEYRDTYSYVFNPDIVGVDLSLNEFEPQDGHFRFAVQAQPGEVKIEVKSDSALPCKLLAAEFESMFVSRSRRYGS
jgi:hypothetical protein